MRIDEFLKEYKELEHHITEYYTNHKPLPFKWLDGKGTIMTVLELENHATDKNMDKLHICRSIRNYAQHNADYKKFISVSDDMMRYIKSLNNAFQYTYIGDIAVRVKPLLLTDTVNDAIKRLIKRSEGYLPIVDNKNEIAGIVTTDYLIEGFADRKIRSSTKLSKIEDIPYEVYNAEHLLADIDINDLEGKRILIHKNDKYYGIVDMGKI